MMLIMMMFNGSNLHKIQGSWIQALQQIQSWAARPTVLRLRKLPTAYFTFLRKVTCWMLAWLQSLLQRFGSLYLIVIDRHSCHFTIDWFASWLKSWCQLSDRRPENHLYCFRKTLLPNFNYFSNINYNYQLKFQRSCFQMHESHSSMSILQFSMR